jgi:hypothetical protein
MKKPAETLAQRREQLIALCHSQRVGLAAQGRLLEQSSGTVCAVAQVVNQIRKSPLLLAGSAIAVMAIRPRRLLSLFASATMAWKAWERIAPVVAPILKRHWK